MPNQDYHELPRFDDSLSYLYLERGTVDKHEKSIAFHDKDGRAPVPAASVRLLMLGPGTKITHAAIQALSDNNCLVVWCGEENVRFYASGMGGTRSAYHLLRQAALASDEKERLKVVHRMYRMRFDEPMDSGLTIQELRGKEGIRVRRSYEEWSRKCGVKWEGRNYDRGRWAATDPANRALSTANSCLYGLCHAAILAAGYSPALGFIHTGKQLSFVYDIGDLYKTEVTFPVAFETAAENPPELDRTVRIRLRDRFRETKLLARVIPDIHAALGLKGGEEEAAALESDPALPTDLWMPSWEREIPPPSDEDALSWEEESPEEFGREEGEET